MDIPTLFASSCESDDNNLLLERVGDVYYRDLVCESAIDPLVALERGYYNSKYDWSHLYIATSGRYTQPEAAKLLVTCATNSVGIW